MNSNVILIKGLLTHHWKEKSAKNQKRKENNLVWDMRSPTAAVVSAHSHACSRQRSVIFHRHFSTFCNAPFYRLDDRHLWEPLRVGLTKEQWERSAETFGNGEKGFLSHFQMVMSTGNMSMSASATNLLLQPGRKFSRWSNIFLKVFLSAKYVLRFSRWTKL